MIGLYRFMEFIARQQNNVVRHEKQVSDFIEPVSLPQPPKSPSIEVSFRTDAHTKAQLDAYCEAQGVSADEAINQFIAFMLRPLIIHTRSEDNERE